MGFRVASQATTRLEIPAFGEWIEVKNELSVGERNAIVKRGVQHAGIGENADGQAAMTNVGVDLQAAKIEKVVQYLVDWSAKNDKNEPISLRNRTEAARREIIRSLSEDTFEAIEAAIDAHETEQARVREGNASAAESTATTS